MSGAPPERAPDGDLSDRLRLLRRFFDLEAVARTEIGQRYVDRYYLVNRVPYSLFFSRRPFVHMGLSDGGTYREDDLGRHAAEVGELVRAEAPDTVLELAAGRGGNSAWLAARHPDVAFLGIDASPTQLGFARRTARGLPNVRLARGDFHDLSAHGDGSIGLVFVVEALCHSNRPEVVLAEVARVLRPGGLFVVYDGYREKPDAATTPDEALAARLLEVGVAVQRFRHHGEVLALAETAGLRPEAAADLTRKVLPTMAVLERRARSFLGRGALAHAAVRLLPRKFTLNAVSGLLFPDLMRSGVFSYRRTVFRKPPAG